MTDILNELNQEEDDDAIKIEYGDIGIPSEIKVLTPKLPKAIKIEHDLPEKIMLEGPTIPEKITIEGPAEPIPEQIKIISDLNIPDSIELIATDVPKTIQLEVDMPESIRLEVPDDFPDTIRLDGSEIPTSIKVVGFPESIPLTHNLPEEIFLKAQDDLEVPLVYKGNPIDVNVKVDLDMQKLIGDNEEELQCVAIVPCPRK
jgi:hypothetical protein